jgi:CRP-like cAMP-binding protein
LAIAPESPTNFLLLLLPSAARTSLLSAGRLEQHERGDVLYNNGDPIQELAFPLSGVISLTVDTSEGQTVEVAIVGNEGFAGVSRFLGRNQGDTNAVVQVAGELLHVPPKAVIEAAAQHSSLRVGIDRYLNSLMVELAQSGVCNHVHSVEQRTARWLLHASDRANTTELRLTHEFLSQMLAVRRASVTTVVGIFSRASLITAKRGLITVADRAGLRTLTCECYDIVRKATPSFD